MADEYDEQTERLLTKFPDSWSPSCQEVCDAVAAVLREAGKREADLLLRLHDWLIANSPGGWIDDLRREVERLKAVVSKCVLGDPPGDCYAADVVTLRGEIAALKAKLAEMRTFAENYRCHCAQKYPGTTKYHGHDCENAVVQEFVEEWLGRVTK